ncbi:hypothetical protein [Deinococcus cellulosilyticus]|uniref:Uncharacterized protein n=1 Tax=Deinococcus cellulosilyticus (strain DSM 18568 / NBRC 106333 / KACC 11606 / 5516J-15) TaxID=1223518 RepID=A0A511N2I7_DEIC1|nr:hypothetical protein [Deinococcus cellulosilyticus]GEM47043.1 hypothetical protein DC3_26780 [Deinococcus cellulosilyticus NBRC 106333 = KACC 11606]
MLFLISLLIGLLIGTLFLGAALLMDRTLQKPFQDMHDLSDASPFPLSTTR